MSYRSTRVIVTNSARKFIGEAAHCLDLVRQLRSAGHEALLVVRKGYELEARANEAGLQTAALTFSSHFSPVSDATDFLSFHRLVRDWKPDIIHCHRGKDHWLAAIHRLICFSRVPLVRTRHVVVPMQRHWLNRWLLRHATARIIAVSKQAACSMSDLASDVRIIYSAVDTERFNPDKRDERLRRELGATSPQDILIGQIARIQNIKGQHIFIAAAAQVARHFPQARFVIAGRGTEAKFEYLRRLIDDHGLSSRFTLLGWVPEIDRLLASLDVSVIASLGSEGSSRIAYETMASGVPLVATRVGCIPEIVEHEENGLLVPPGDADALGRAIESLLVHPDRARRLADLALARIRTYHTYERWLQEILDVYKEAHSAESGRA